MGKKNQFMVTKYRLLPSTHSLSRFYDPRKRENGRKKKDTTRLQTMNSSVRRSSANEMASLPRSRALPWRMAGFETVTNSPIPFELHFRASFRTSDICHIQTLALDTDYFVLCFGLPVELFNSGLCCVLHRMDR